MRVEPLEWVLGFSKRLLVILTVVYLGALCIFWLLPILLFLKLGGTALLCLHFKHIMHMHFFRNHRRAVVKLWQDPKGHFGCQFYMGQSAYGQLKGDSFQSNRLIIVRLRISARVIHVIIHRDSLKPEAYSILYWRLKQS